MAFIPTETTPPIILFGPLSSSSCFSVVCAVGQQKSKAEVFWDWEWRSCRCCNPARNGVMGSHETGLVSSKCSSLLSLSVYAGNVKAARKRVFGLSGQVIGVKYSLECSHLGSARFGLGVEWSRAAAVDGVGVSWLKVHHCYRCG